MNSFGQKLRTEREKQGYNLEAVAEGTKIRKLYLNALEDDDFDQLPPRVYATGFVASYARFLKMDVDALVEEFKAQAYPIPPVPAPVGATKKKVRKRIRKAGKVRKIAIKNIVAALLFLAVIWWLGSYLASYIAQQAVDKQTMIQADPVVQVPEAVPSIGVANNTPDSMRLVIAARQQCWLEVSCDGVNQYTGTMNAGEQFSYEARQSIVVRAGNAGGIELSLNDQKLPPLGAVGQVVERKYDMSSMSKE